MLNYTLRKATPDDVQLSYDIRKNALQDYITKTWGWDEDWQWKYHVEDFDTSIMQIIECDGIAAGSLELVNEADSIRVTGVYIIDKFQSKGIGEDIMKDVIAKAAEEKKDVVLQVLKVNNKAQEFYKRLGFIQTGESNSHYQLIYKNDKVTCKNCGNQYEGKFCNNCGQKAGIHRFSIGHISHELIHGFIHLDKGILYLIKEMCIRPGYVAKEYIEGKRNKYFNPFQFLILGVAVITFITIKLDLGFGAAANIQVNSDSAAELEKITSNITKFFYNYFNLLQFLSIPLLSVFSYLFFRRSGYNYAENLVFNTFLFAQRCLIYLLFTPFFYFFKDSTPVIARIYLFVWFAYFMWSYVQFFRKDKTWPIIIKGFLAISVFFIVNSSALVLIIIKYFE